MPNMVRITVDGPDDLLNANMYNVGAVVRLHWSAAEAGTYASVGTAALAAGTRIYTIYDVNGTTSTWYRTRYENAGATVTSEWSASFQVSVEEAGYLCSLYDVKQALGRSTTDTTADEELLELIAEVTDDITGYTGRKFIRSPLSGSTTFLFDVECYSTTLRVPQGLAAVTQVEYATASQPDTGGTFAILAATAWTLRPVAHQRDTGWPATQVVILDTAGLYFYPGTNTVRLTGATGWASPPRDVSGIARRAIVKRYKNAGGATVNRGGDATDISARWAFSLEDQRRLDWYRVRNVA